MEALSPVDATHQSSDDLKAQLATQLQQSPQAIHRLHGGSIAGVYLVRLEDQQQVVAKTNLPGRGGDLLLEAQMLTFLRTHTTLPVPAVILVTPDLLVMDYLPGESVFGNLEQQHAAELVAALHQHTAPDFGFPYDTLIGGLPQPNPPTARWIPFFRDHRLLYMADLARREGKLPAALYNRLERLAANLDSLLIEPAQPALLHGDLWTTNMLAQADKMTGFLDPALYYGHPEIELAFTTLFGTFNGRFFARYREINPLEPGFVEVRRDLYNLYPLLVHVRLFGSSYLPPIELTLRRFGC